MRRRHYLMRYLAEDDRFDVICSGSMLGVEAYDFDPCPSGSSTSRKCSLDFEEFCLSREPTQRSGMP
ncbi:MAG: hypothetical protein ACLR67_05325 [Eggerthella lenta]